MMKKTMLYATFLASASLISFEAFTNSGGAPSGSSGSPLSSNNTCARSGCHSGGPSVGSRTISVTNDIPATGFLPNTDYNFTVTANGNAGDPRVGFQTSIESGSMHVGTLSTNGSNALRKVGSYLGHSSSGISATNGMRTWSFKWNSGNSPDQSNMYVAVNFANGNGGTSGDAIASDIMVLTKNNSISVDEGEAVSSFSLAPNPANHWVNLEGLPEDTRSVRILDLSGKEVAQFGNLEWSDGHVRLPLEAIGEGHYLVIPEGKNLEPRQLFILR